MRLPGPNLNLDRTSVRFNRFRFRTSVQNRTSASLLSGQMMYPLLTAFLQCSDFKCLWTYHHTPAYVSEDAEENRLQHGELELGICGKHIGKRGDGQRMLIFEW